MVARRFARSDDESHDDDAHRKRARYEYLRPSIRGQ